MNYIGLQEKTISASELQLLLDETAQGIDDASHEVGSWTEYVASFLECLEFHAMANDPYHPEQFEQMLTRLQDRIAARLKEKIW